MSNNKISKIPDYNSGKNANNIEHLKDNEYYFQNMIDIINNFLGRCLSENEINYQDLYKSNFIKAQYSYIIKPGFFSWTEGIKLDLEIWN